MIAADKYRFRWLAAGRRWQKTTLAMATAVRENINGKTILWGAPTYDQCRIGWREMERAAGGVAQFNQGRMEVDFPTGGRTIFRSLDNPDNARGHTAHGIIVDEAPLVGERAWYDVLRPIISDTGGWALLLGTPKGHNWYWRESMAAKDYPDSIAWQVPTLGVEIVDGRLVRKPHPMENPNFPFAEAERMFQTLPQKTFEQEFLAEFVEDAGLVFRNVRAVSTGQPEQPKAGHEYVFGVDWAKAYDFTVISVIDATSKKQVEVDRFNKIDYEFQIGRLKVLTDRYQPSVIVAEANSMGEPLIDLIRKRGMADRVQAFTTTSASKALIIEGLSLAIEKGDITLLADEEQINELQSYDMTRLPGGSFRYGAPEGMHDDMVMALALSYSPLMKKSTKVEMVRYA